jgi:Ran GTPase-activating protein (RanGAP) involved in mRNA processing and transport
VASARAGAAVHFAQVVAEVSHPFGKPNDLHLQLTGRKEPAPGLFDAWSDAPRPVVSLLLSKLRFDAAEIGRLCAALAASPVRELHINDCDLRNEAVVALAKNVAALKLDVLDLGDNEIGKAGAEALAASPGLATVRVLRLNGNPLRPAGVDALAASPHLKALERVALPGKDIAPRRQNDIRAKFGKGVVVEF